VKGHKDYEGNRASDIPGKAEIAGAVLPGEEKALGDSINVYISIST